MFSTLSVLEHPKIIIVNKNNQFGTFSTSHYLYICIYVIAQTVSTDIQHSHNNCLCDEQCTASVCLFTNICAFLSAIFSPKPKVLHRFNAPRIDLSVLNIMKMK